MLLGLGKTNGVGFGRFDLNVICQGLYTKGDAPSIVEETISVFQLDKGLGRQ
jgi:hypothetical protein